MNLQLKDFAYILPDSSIAQEPQKNKELHKILYYSKAGIQDSTMASFDALIPPNSLLILNDTKVIPSRIHCQNENGAKIEIFLTENLCKSTNRWRALGKPMKKIRVGSTVQFQDRSIATILEKIESTQTPTIELEFGTPWNEFEKWLNLYGKVPLPPYIKRPNQKLAKDSDDLANYQTEYALTPGSVAAPTAGLHFTDTKLSQLSSKGIDIASTTLHVGLGTFLPVKTDDINKHAMHSEKYLIPEDTHQKIITAKNSGRPIIAVGTTTFRSLESFYSMHDPKTNRWHSTDLFIYPNSTDDRYNTKVVDLLMTNFHQPGSTLLMLVSALIGFDEVKKLYAHAINSDYQFLSYGDASLLDLR